MIDSRRNEILCWLATAGALSLALESEASADVCYDYDAPTLEVIDPMQDMLELQAGSILLIDVVANDLEACSEGVEKITVTVDGEACREWQDADWPYEGTVEQSFEMELPPGEHSVVVTATDGASQSSEPVTLTVTVVGEGDGEYDCGMEGAGDGDGDGDGDAGATGEGDDGESGDGSGCRVPARGVKPVLAWVLALGAGAALSRRRRRAREQS